MRYFLRSIIVWISITLKAIQLLTVFPDSKHDQIGDYLLKLFERKPRFISGKKFNKIYGFLVKYLEKFIPIKFRRKFSSHGNKLDFWLKFTIFGTFYDGIFYLITLPLKVGT